MRGDSLKKLMLKLNFFDGSVNCLFCAQDIKF